MPAGLDEPEDMRAWKDKSQEDKGLEDEAMEDELLEGQDRGGGGSPRRCEPPDRGHVESGWRSRSRLLCAPPTWTRVAQLEKGARKKVLPALKGYQDKEDF